jgi:outer membrane protein OmpA-like peptidoglycan-associated protein
MTSARHAATAIVAIALSLTACTGDVADTEPSATGQDTEGSRSGDPEASDASDEVEERERPRSSVSTEAVDAPQSAAEIRVGEIIVEFDGQVVDEGTLLTLEEPILFDFGSDELRSSAGDALDDIAEVLVFYDGAPVQVIGHTDDVGSAEFNLDLSERRAAAVTDGLTGRGIDASRITSTGRGLTEPVATNDTDEGRAQNRRVEVLIVGVEPPATD